MFYCNRVIVSHKLNKVSSYYFKLTCSHKPSRVAIAVDVEQNPQVGVRGQMVQEYPFMFIVHKVVHLSRPVHVKRDPVAALGVVLPECTCPVPLLVREIGTGIFWKVAR